jgi:hypothetical protein
MPLAANSSPVPGSDDLFALAAAVYQTLRKAGPG